MNERATLESPEERSRAWLTGRTRIAVAGAVLAPLALLAVIRLWRTLDAEWESHPAHFWLVLAAAASATSLGLAVHVTAVRRRDARLVFLGLAFVASAGFLGLHALATPGVLVGPNAGFELATPVGLLLAGALVAVSGVEFSPAASRRVVAYSSWMLGVLFVVMAGWATVSLAELPPLNDPVQQESLNGWQIALCLGGVSAYGLAAVAYLRLYRRRRQRLILAVAFAFALLAEAMVVIVFARNWHLSWWEWHLLMLGAFATIFAASRQEWREERFSALYLERTLAGSENVSVLFADLQGYTSFSERTPARAVSEMLNTYFAALIPLMERHGAEVHQLIGDAMMVVFNKSGDQPGHPLVAARAALEFQQEASRIGAAHPDWPAFRVGLNSGDVAAGVVGSDRGLRKYDVIGDTVNLAARLEAAAPVGEVVIGEGTFASLPDGSVVEELPPLRVKGKSDPVTAYVLKALPS
jgi:adenylate cyclase